MNNFIKKVSLLVLLLTFTFFSFSTKVFALNAYGVMPRRASYNNADLTYIRKDVTKGKLGLIGIYMVASGISDENKQHAYCIEPGTAMPTNRDKFNSGGFSATAQELDAYRKSGEGLINSPEKFSMIKRVLNFAPKLTTEELDAAISLYKDCFDSCPADKMKKFEKVFGAQGLIWEIVTGERTTLCDKATLLTNGFYNTIKNRDDLKEAKNEYNSILNKIKNSYCSFPGGGGKGYKFLPGGLASTYTMEWKNNKFVLEIIDTKGNATESDKFKYWEVLDSADLDVKIDSSGTKLTISSNTNFEGIKQIKIGIKNQNGQTATAYYKTDTKTAQYQDVTTIGGDSLQAYINVTVPMYQLKLTKESSLDGKKLSGIKFDVCKDLTCNTKFDSIITDEKGVAISKKIPSPGTYYVKEINTLNGYKQNTTPTKIEVVNSNVVGTDSYAEETIINENKEFELIKYTIDETGQRVTLDDGCGTEKYTGPKFKIADSKGNPVYLKKLEDGVYEYSSKEEGINEIKTCNGAFTVYTLPECTYTISEISPPEGLMATNIKQTVNTCSTRGVTFINAKTGFLEFRKKDEHGNLITGGKFALQIKKNNIYRDVLLKEISEGTYSYVSDLSEEDDDATYILLTNDGIATISDLSPGEYRIVEKEAPEEYEPIEDKDSSAIVTINDDATNNYYLVELINKKVNTSGSDATAELVVTITTGRSRINYIVVIPSLLVLLTLIVVIRKKLKK